MNGKKTAIDRDWLVLIAASFNMKPESDFRDWTTVDLLREYDRIAGADAQPEERTD